MEGIRIHVLPRMTSLCQSSACKIYTNSLLDVAIIVGVGAGKIVVASSVETSGGSICELDAARVTGERDQTEIYNVILPVAEVGQEPSPHKLHHTCTWAYTLIRVRHVFFLQLSGVHSLSRRGPP